MKIKKFITVLILALIFAVCGTAGIFALAETNDYYVVFSNQNYSVKNSNKMEDGGDGNYYLKKVSLTSAVKFYVVDSHGVHYYSSRGEELETDESGDYRYNIKFSPSAIFDSEEGGYKATNCHVSYAFYIPESYSVNVGGDAHELSYNPYFTTYDLYCISSIEVEAGTEISYSTETHTIADAGAYRILFTPTVVRDGKEYAFDVDGNYGSGEEYTYNLYIEDAPLYYAVFDSGVAKFAKGADAEIEGQPAYSLSRYEKNATAEEYRYDEIFISARDAYIKYRIYEKEPAVGYRLIDDDNNDDTNISSIQVADVGWYGFSLTCGGDIYSTSAEWNEKPLGGYFAVGSFNNYCFNSDGGLDIDNKFEFVKVEEEDDDYNADYDQYILYLSVTDKDIEDENVEFYISDGTDKYKNGTDYISLNTAGEYKILFSDEHIYSQGRYYRATLLDEKEVSNEIEISSVDEFLAFSNNCALSADYSENLSVYLTCDLDFGGKQFVPVKSFGGKFYGGYHTLKNIEVSSDYERPSVFEVVTRSGSVERLKAENLKISDDSAEYVGFVAENYGTLKYITVSGNVTGGGYVGGVAGYNGVSRIDDNSASLDSNNVVQKGVLENCKNTSVVTGKSNVGGVVGFNSGDIITCENGGKVLPYTGTNTTLTNIGGIAGFSAGKISNCTNTGKVGESSYALYVGGIAGFCTGECYFSLNSGEVAGRKYAGGIIGGYGNVTDNSADQNDHFGGLDYGEIIDNYFNGSENTEEVLIGERHNLIYLQNTGSVTADNYCAGILADSSFDSLEILNSYSTGNITCTGGGYAGGILGNGIVTLSGCFTSGKIKASGVNSDYVGGIAGNGSIVRECMTSAEVYGTDYVGGIAGNITNYVFSSYSNAVLVFDNSSLNVGMIAGHADGFNISLNTFPENFKYNYYIPSSSAGIGGQEYAQKFDYAAAEILPEKLASKDNLSIYLNENFNHEFWQGGGENSYPVLTYMSECYDIADIDDEEELFALHLKNLQGNMNFSSAEMFTVVFMEWNKDNGDLFEDGEIQYENFDEIYSVRVAAGSNVEPCPLKYAEAKDGRWIYTGDDKVYFVNLSQAYDVHENKVVYAEYTPTISTLSTEDGKVLAEGLFAADTKLKLVKSGDYYSLEFYLGGEKIEVGKYIVKFEMPNPSSKYKVVFEGEDEKEVVFDVYGNFLRFEWESGMFSIREQSVKTLTVLEIVLISVLGGLVLCAAVGTGVYFGIKNKKAKRNKEEKPE